MKKLKVFGVPWHVAHQYELAKLSFIESYDLLRNPYRNWGDTSRPMPDNMQFVNYYQAGKYDLVILHIDQQAIYDPEAGDRIRKGRLYLEVRQLIKDEVPIVVINHMTPFHDKYETSYVIQVIKELTAGTHVVCNSFEASKQWGFGTPIIHGMDPDEWWDLPKEPRAVVALSSGGMEKAYRRIFLHSVIRELREMQVPFTWIGVDKKFGSFDDYRDYLGRSLVYFNPTWQSPRPRARTEAMLSGCCVVTTPYQDASTFIEHGVNGFLTNSTQYTDPRIMDNPEATAKIIKELVIDKPDEAIKIGQVGKAYAREHFNHDNFEKQWQKFLTEEVKVWG